MITVTLDVGDKLRALFDNPLGAGILAGEVATITGFYRDGSPIVLFNGREWMTPLKELFKAYEKVGG